MEWPAFDFTALRQRDLHAPVNIAVLGDTLLDQWVFVEEMIAGQDHCASVRTRGEALTPGGAANVARQLGHWNARVQLIGPLSRELRTALRFWGKNVLTELCFNSPKTPIKTRYLGEKALYFRADQEPPFYGLPNLELQECRDLAVKAIETMSWDVVVLVDYEKGFLTNETIQRTIMAATARGIPVVADPKRHVSQFRGAILKANAAYRNKHTGYPLADSPYEKILSVVTNGAKPPDIREDGRWRSVAVPSAPVLCRNHVGAGDCFAAHLGLGLALGLLLPEAVVLAHAAGRVYVQGDLGVPPWPHVIAKDLDPLRGKVIAVEQVRALRASLPDNVVFSNGVFRLPHAGHAWLCQWARQQGDVLVVGVNDDASAARLRPGQKVLRLAERVAMLAALEAVDWVVPFAEDTPEATMELLRPHILVKGHEYAEEAVPGADLVEEVRFAPASPFPGHATSILASLRDGNDASA
jgi:D-beta-D-heptose 7-phosphate kinase/D-beta-D-heptose 1-phosphate adenosyltransferase